MTDYERRDQPDVRWKGDDFPYHPSLHGGSIDHPVHRSHRSARNPLNIFQDTTSVRDDFTTSFDWGGRHDMKIGGEYLRFGNDFSWCLRCMGSIDAQRRAHAERGTARSRCFRMWNDASTWNLAPLAAMRPRRGPWFAGSTTLVGHRAPATVTRHLWVAGCRTTGA